MRTNGCQTAAGLRDVGVQVVPLALRRDRLARAIERPPLCAAKVSATVSAKGSRAATSVTMSGQTAELLMIGAGGGNRTLTGRKPHGILSPARLPVSPLRRREDRAPWSRHVPGPDRSDEDLDLALRLDLLDELLELLLALTLREEILDLAADFDQRRGPRPAALVHLDEVKPERGLDDGADGARLELEGGLLERRRHLPFREES